MLDEEEEIDDGDVASIEDDRFDQIYSPKIRQLSSLHWTPVSVAAEAARLLVNGPGTRVLDIGCGPGKFCLVAASLTDGHFTGVEQRADLVEAAREAAAEMHCSNAEFVHANITDVAFSNFDAFYLFNPFEENMAQGHKIDSAVSLSPALFKKYARYVSAQLGAKPLGTRIVTYAGYGDEVPSCYRCQFTRFGDDLKLWLKECEYDPEIEELGLSAKRSYRGAQGWAAPRTA